MRTMAEAEAKENIDVVDFTPNDLHRLGVTPYELAIIFYRDNFFMADPNLPKSDDQLALEAEIDRLEAEGDFTQADIALNDLMNNCPDALAVLESVQDYHETELLVEYDPLRSAAPRDTTLYRLMLSQLTFEDFERGIEVSVSTEKRMTVAYLWSIAQKEASARCLHATEPQYFKVRNDIAEVVGSTIILEGTTFYHVPLGKKHYFFTETEVTHLSKQLGDEFLYWALAFPETDPLDSLPSQVVSLERKSLELTTQGITNAKTVTLHNLLYADHKSGTQGGIPLLADGQEEYKKAVRQTAIAMRDSPAA